MNVPHGNIYLKEAQRAVTQAKITPPPPHLAFPCLPPGERRNNSSRVYKLREVSTRQLARRATASKCTRRQVNQSVPPPVSATNDLMDKRQESFFAGTLKRENSRFPRAAPPPPAPLPPQRQQRAARGACAPLALV